MQEREPELSIGVNPLLCLRSQGRNSPIRRIHNQRRAPARGSDGEKDSVICAADIGFGSPLRAVILPLLARSQPVQLSDFGVCEKFFPGVLFGSLEGYLVIVGPDAFEVRVPPCCLKGHTVCSGRCLRRFSRVQSPTKNGRQLGNRDDDRNRDRHGNQ